MIAYHHTAGEDAKPREHPWTTALADQSQRYVDFKSEPGLIRSALEDWVPYKNERFAESFFQLMEWLHSSENHLESNDCAFRDAHLNTTDRQFKFAKRCDGRLMILYRDIYLNTQPLAVNWLFNATLKTLQQIDPKFLTAAVGLSRAKAVYLALGDGVKRGGLGDQISLSFFAYGDSRRAAHASMERLLRNVYQTLHMANARIARGEVQALFKPAP